MIGTFALVFAGAGAVMVDAKTGALGQVGIALTFGLVIAAMVYAVGHISGAHFNPAADMDSSRPPSAVWQPRATLPRRGASSTGRELRGRGC